MGWALTLLDHYKTVQGTGLEKVLERGQGGVLKLLYELGDFNQKYKTHEDKGGGNRHQTKEHASETVLARGTLARAQRRDVRVGDGTSRVALRHGVGVITSQLVRDADSQATARPESMIMGCGGAAQGSLLTRR